MDYEVMMNGTVRIGQMAPDFEAVTTFGNIQLSDYKGKWLVLFSHPGDFTPVKSASLGEYSLRDKRYWLKIIVSFCIINL